MLALAACGIELRYIDGVRTVTRTEVAIELADGIMRLHVFFDCLLLEIFIGVGH